MLCQTFLWLKANLVSPHVSLCIFKNSLSAALVNVMIKAQLSAFTGNHFEFLGSHSSHNAVIALDRATMMMMINPNVGGVAACACMLERALNVNSTRL